MLLPMQCLLEVTRMDSGLGNWHMMVVHPAEAKGLDMEAAVKGNSASPMGHLNGFSGASMGCPPEWLQRLSMQLLVSSVA